jgi:hypothetical protein
MESGNIKGNSNCPISIGSSARLSPLFGLHAPLANPLPLYTAPNLLTCDRPCGTTKGGDAYMDAQTHNKDFPVIPTCSLIFIP